MKDNRMKSPFMMPKKTQSRINASRIKGRNQNMTIDPISVGLRSQSPNIYSPMIQIKYETNNHYNVTSAMPHQVNSPTYNQEFNSFHQAFEQPVPKMPNVMIDGSFLNRTNNGFMSPQNMDARTIHNFPQPTMGRVASPVPTNLPSRAQKRKKSNTFKMKKAEGKC